MGLPYNGQISMGDINVELGRARTTSNTQLAGASTPTTTSLFGLASSSVNKVPPHSISEFYGYVQGSITFSGLYSIGYTGTVTGTVTIVGTAYNFSAGSIQYGSGKTTTTITVNGITRSQVQFGAGSSYSESFQLGPGTYSYSLTVSISGSGSGFISTSQVDPPVLP